jgi:hypothetical protein
MKRISLLALTLAAGMAAWTQEGRLKTTMASKPYFGVKAGVNLAEFRVHNISPKPDVNMKTSFNGGFLINIPLAGKFAVQPELIYSGAGSKITQKTTIGTVTTTQTYEQDLGYIALPIMFQIKSMGGFFVELGPQPAYLVHAKQDGPGSAETDNKSSFDNFDISLAGGLGYTSRVGLGINARYNLGLSNVLEDNGGNNSPNNGAELKNSIVQIGLYYLFGAKK